MFKTKKSTLQLFQYNIMSVDFLYIKKSLRFNLQSILNCTPIFFYDSGQIVMYLYKSIPREIFYYKIYFKLYIMNKVVQIR